MVSFCKPRRFETTLTYKDKACKNLPILIFILTFIGLKPISSYPSSVMEAKANPKCCHPLHNGKDFEKPLTIGDQVYFFHYIALIKFPSGSPFCSSLRLHLLRFQIYELVGGYTVIKKNIRNYCSQDLDVIPSVSQKMHSLAMNTRRKMRKPANSLHISRVPFFQIFLLVSVYFFCAIGPSNFFIAPEYRIRSNQNSIWNKSK